MSEVNYKTIMANDVSIMNLSENEVFSSFIVIDQNNKQYYVGAYDLDHLSDFVNANEPVSDFSEFKDTLRNYFFSTASSESVPNTSNPDELLKCKHLTEFARQLNIKLDGGSDPLTERNFFKISYISNGNVPYTKDGNNLTLRLKPSQINRSGSIYNYYIYFLSYDITNQNWCIPVVTNTTLSATKFTGEFPSSNLGRVGIAVTSTDVPQPGDVISFTVTVPGADIYLDSTFNVTINIIEEE